MKTTFKTLATALLVSSGLVLTGVAAQAQQTVPSNAPPTIPVPNPKEISDQNKAKADANKANAAQNKADAKAKEKKADQNKADAKKADAKKAADKAADKAKKVN